MKGTTTSRISIPEPCTENYSRMGFTEAGRHCQRCQAEVVDFTHMSAGEIQAFFSKPSNAAVCGRYRPGQVQSVRLYDRLVESLRSRMERIRFRPMRLAFLGLLSGMMVFTNCIMGKRFDPSMSRPDNDRRDTTQQKLSTPPEKK